MKIEIRAWKTADSNSLVKAANHADISKTLRDGFPFPYTEKDADAGISLCKDKAPITTFAIVAENIVAGSIGFVLKDNIYRKNAEIGYWLGKPFWNKEIATEAVRQIVYHIFSRHDIARVYAEVFSNNPASMKVLEKNGFQLEAVHKKSIIKNNEMLDDYCWVKFSEGFFE